MKREYCEKKQTDDFNCMFCLHYVPRGASGSYTVKCVHNVPPENAKHWRKTTIRNIQPMWKWGEQQRRKEVKQKHGLDS